MKYFKYGAVGFILGFFEDIINALFRISRVLYRFSHLYGFSRFAGIFIIGLCVQLLLIWNSADNKKQKIIYYWIAYLAGVIIFSVFTPHLLGWGTGI